MQLAPRINPQPAYLVPWLPKEPLAVSAPVVCVAALVGCASLPVIGPPLGLAVCGAVALSG